MSTYNNSEKDIKFIVSRSPSRIHVINTCETIDENIERILQEQGYSDEEVRKLTSQYTFRLYTDGLVLDARDVFEAIELTRCLPDLYALKMYRYTPDELLQRQAREEYIHAEDTR